MSLEVYYPIAAGAVNGNGSEIWGAGALAANVAAGITSLTLPQGVDSAEISCQVTIRGVTAGMVTVEQTSDTVKKVHTFNTSGTSTNLDFDYLFFQRPNT